MDVYTYLFDQGSQPYTWPGPVNRGADMEEQLQELRCERLAVWTKLKQLQDCGSSGMTAAHRGIFAHYHAQLEQLDSRIADLQDPGMKQKREMLNRLQGGNAVNVLTTPVGPSGSGIADDSPDVRYPRLVMDFEALVKAHHQASINQPGSASQATREKAIVALDDEIKALCKQLGYPYFSWKCITDAAGYPQIVYERPPREIIDELFTEITGLNPEDTYDGWREAFINTGLTSALEHMKEHVR